MGLLTESRDVTARLYFYIQDGIGGISVDRFHTEYRDYRNNKQKMKGKDISLDVAEAIVKRVKNFGFIEVEDRGEEEHYIITVKGYELINTVWKLHTGVAKAYFQRYTYVSLVISISALIVAILALFKK